MDAETKNRKIREKYNRKIEQRIEQQQDVLDYAEIDLAVAEKLENASQVARHKARIENVKKRIAELKNLIEKE